MYITYLFIFKNACSVLSTEKIDDIHSYPDNKKHTNLHLFKARSI